MYDKSLSENFCIELYVYETNKYLIIPKEEIDNQSFNFLVNYLYYPENIKYKPKISGYTVVKDTALFSKEKLNYEIEIFIPENDTEYDNVYVVTQYNEVAKINFGGKTISSALSRNYDKPQIDFSTLSSPQILKKKKLNQKKASHKEKERIKSRTTIISMLILTLVIISYVFIENSKSFGLTTGLIFVGIWGWFIFDYKMLQHLSFYLMALAISILIIIYSSFLIHKLLPLDNRFIRSASFLPFFLLIIQFPLRRLFIKILKREPVIDKPAPSLADFVYTMILWMASIVFPFITIK
jgi:hypothetical protein